MTQAAIEALYNYGKKVYENSTSLNEATNDFLKEYSDYAAEGSARFYIKLYSDFMMGKNVTWNMNTELVVYYIDSIISDKGIEAGRKAFDSAMAFALSKSNKVLIDSLEGILKKYEKQNWWPSTEEYDPSISKEKWLELLHKLSSNEWRGVLAMFFTEKEGATCSALAEKFDMQPMEISGRCTTLAKWVYKQTDCRLFEDEKTEQYWLILFYRKETASGEKGNYIWKLRPELYDALTEFDILRFLPGSESSDEDEIEFNLSPKETVEHIKNYISSKGFTYSGKLIENFYLCIKSKPFTILAGTSGTGKTRLVKLFAEAIGITDGRFKLVPVRPDWSDSSDLFGHLDLNGNYVAGEILEFIAKAQREPNRPYILCLDEMNLARVEYYLSDFLSVIETREVQGESDKIVSEPLVTLEQYGTDAGAKSKYGEIRFPQNLYLVGTVNMDETTFPFSRKVLDRANTIEFDFVDLNSIPDTDVQTVQPVTVPNEFLRTKSLFLNQCMDDPKFVGDICKELQKINEVLLKANAHVGYRVRDEIVFYMVNNKEADLLADEEAMDNEIMQKILPRIQGSSVSVKVMLCELFRILAGDYDGYQTKSGDVASKMTDKLDKMEKSGEKIQYPKSARKVAFMVRRFEEDGFTSYWL